MDGTPFGRYRLLGSLGEGGMGQVFRAYDPAHDREVALKVLSPLVAQDPSFEQRFRHEAHVVARLNDPHVVPIHSYGEIDGRFYVDMVLIAGRDLGSVLEESGPMDPARVVKIVDQVADALDAAHSINLVHRDIKPSNVLLTKKDFAYLIDFGIAQDTNTTRMTKTGLTIGTFAYMAPERIDTGEAAPSSDIYSLACVLYECLTGELPFPGDSVQQQIAWHLSKPPPCPSAIAPGVPEAFDEVIVRGMAKDPGQRYPTVTALAEAARDALERPPRQMPPTQIPTQGATTQQAAPLPGPPAPTHAASAPPAPGPAAPWPPAPGPSYAAPAPWGPPLGGDAAPVRAPSQDQQPRRPVNFVVPGVLVTTFAAISIIFAISEFWTSGLYKLGSTAGRLVEFGYLSAWLALAAAFGLIARGCRAGERAVTITAWLTCAAALVGALPWGIALFARPVYWFLGICPGLTFLALIAFGVVAHRSFGWWWSVPASVGGFLGALGDVMSEGDLYGDYSYATFLVYDGSYGTPASASWLVPLLILGIAMCRHARRVV
jgi:serine/threonine-protein kinase